MNEAAANSEGMKSLTDKEIADYLRNEAPYIVAKIYRALKKDAGPYQLLRNYTTTITVEIYDTSTHFGY